MHLLREPCRLPCGTAGTVPSTSRSTAGLGLRQMPLDAAIGRLFALYCPGGRHGHRFCRKKSSCGVVKSLFKASVKKAPNGPSTQLIKATSCVDRSNTTINSLKPKSILAGMKNSCSKGFWLAKHQHTNIPTMMEPFSPPAAWLCWPSVPHPCEPLQKGFVKAAAEGFQKNQ